MADKAITDLNVVPGSIDDGNTWFAVAQSGAAYKVSGHQFVLAMASIWESHGGIRDIVYTEPVAPSLTGTLTITLADDTEVSFDVENGKGITSITKTGTVDLVDTYTITYNDGTTTSFTVTNGEKGDTGDAWYVWIRYAGEEPTQDSDIGTDPDNWMGVYSGTSSTAPVHYTDYDWFQIKGAKGDTGDAATIVSQSVSYQQGDSPNIQPSGTWLPTIPAVAQGKYLWTKTDITFNSGSPITFFSVARMGVDGAGSVSSVNGQSPDGNGNVTVTATDIQTTDSTSVQSDLTGLKNTLNSLDSDDIANASTNVSGATVTAAIDNLSTALATVPDFAPKTAIPQNSNLNDYRTAGTYYVQTDAIAATVSNMPRSASGTLLVIYRSNKNTYLQQFYLPTSTIRKIYTRTYNNGTWTSWGEIPTDIFVITGTRKTSAAGTTDFAETYNCNEYMCLSVVATGAVAGYILLPYKYGDAANGRWGFQALTSGDLSTIKSTSIAYAAVMMKYA